MSELFALRLIAAFFGVPGMLVFGAWYLYYRSVSSRSHTRMCHTRHAGTLGYVPDHCVLLGGESALGCCGCSGMCAMHGHRQWFPHLGIVA